jgi:hypothetical protein
MKNQKFFSQVIILIILFALLSGCGAKSNSIPGIGYGGQTAIETAPREAVMESAVSNNTTGSSLPSDKPVNENRLVIKNATLTLIVADPEASMDRITQLADEMGGFVVSANINQSQLNNGQEVPRGSITIRIPSDSLYQALSQIEKESNQPPENKTIQSQDVTSDYTDLQSRLRNLEDAEEQLRTIMDSAYNTEDVLSVYNRLVEVREQIEVLKGQIQYYDQATALSAISVELIANAAIQPIKIGGWQPVGVAKEAIQALLDTLQTLVNVFIWTIIFVLPVLAVIYLIFILPLTRIWRFVQKHRKQKKPVTETENNKTS